MEYIKYLEDIENRIDIEIEEELYNNWVKFAEGNWEENYFHPKRSKKILSRVDWPEININDALEDNSLMLIDQLSACNRQLESGSGKLMIMRSNYGVGILPSLYGAKEFIMPYETNTLPNVYPLEGGIEGIRNAIENGVPDLRGEWGEKVFSFGEMMLEIKSKYPKIAKYIRIDHPDCQGPMDLCELLWGSEIFYDLYDKADLVHGLLGNVTNTYKAFLDKWFELCPNTDSYHVFFGAMHKGQITIRDDSAMNLSPNMYKEFIYPYDEELFTYFSGGCMHYCGRGEHFIEKSIGMKGLNAINLSQPHLNDMDIIFGSTIDRGVNIIGLSEDAVKQAEISKRNLHGLVHTE